MGTADLVGYHIPSEPNPEERVLSLIPISGKYRMTLLLAQLHHSPSTCQGELKHMYRNLNRSELGRTTVKSLKDIVCKTRVERRKIEELRVHMLHGQFRLRRRPFYWLPSTCAVKMPN